MFQNYNRKKARKYIKRQHCSGMQMIKQKSMYGDHYFVLKEIIFFYNFVNRKNNSFKFTIDIRFANAFKVSTILT